jgi:hypothetical protein
MTKVPQAEMLLMLARFANSDSLISRFNLLTRPNEYTAKEREVFGEIRRLVSRADDVERLVEAARKVFEHPEIKYPFELAEALKPFEEKP